MIQSSVSTFDCDEIDARFPWAGYEYLVLCLCNTDTQFLLN